MEQWKNLANHGIELLDYNYGREVKAFYESIGVKNWNSFNYTSVRRDGDNNRFYYIDEHGRVDNVSENFCNEYNIKIVTLDEARAIVNGTTATTNSLLPQNTETLFVTKKIVGKVLL